MAYSFTIGTQRALALQDFEDTAPVERYFVNLTPEQYAAISPEPTVTTSYTFMALETADGWFLLDSGLGTLLEGKSRLLSELASEGITPADIRGVYLTHAHADHYAGLTDGQGQLTFPNARHFMLRAEWEDWTGRLESIAQEAPHRAAMMRSHLLPLSAHMTFLDAGAHFWPGLQAVSWPGHTAHHSGVRIEADGETFLYIADAALHPLHLLNPGWVSAMDNNEQVTISRQQIVAEALEKNACLLATHFPFPSLGRVVQGESGITWQPASL